MDNIIENIKKGMQTAKTEAGKLTKVVMDKTNSLVDSTKLTLAKNSTENKLNELYSQIGKAVYEEYRNGAEFDGEIGVNCVEIDKFRSELDDLNEQLAELKNIVECPDCGQACSKDSDYCPKCGTKLTDADNTIPFDTTVDVIPDCE